VIELDNGAYMNKTENKIGFIGAGNMGGALIEGFIAKGAVSPADVFVSDNAANNAGRFAQLGVNIAANNIELVQNAGFVILAVKPKDAIAVLKETAGALRGKALLSIVAGLNYKMIYGALAPNEVRVLVTLPNTPAKVARGAAGFTLETSFTQEEKDLAQKLFESVGIVEWVSEKYLNIVSALSGGAPAYTAMFIEALADGAVLEGLPRDIAYRLAAQTVLGTGELFLKTGLHPGAIKDAVCSPGGTTIEAVKALEEGAFRHSVMNAIRESSQKFLRLL